MLIIKSPYFEFNIDDKKEYAIYFEEYEADRHGQPRIKEPKNFFLNFNYPYGHIIFETEYKRYILETVQDPDDWVFEILNYIDLHRNEKNIIIDLFELRKDSNGDFYEFLFGDCRTERI